MIVTLSIVVLFTYAVGSAVGFGASAMALAVAALVYPLNAMVLVIVPLNVVTTAYLTMRHWGDVDRRLLLTRILPMVCLGLPGGILLFLLTDAGSLKRLFGVFVAVIGALELVHALRHTGEASPPRGASRLWLVAGGFIHGLWASGGPLVVYWAGRTLSAKGPFRATLMAMWLVLNSILLISHLGAGSIDLDSARISASLLPALVFGIAVGERLHDRLSEGGFRVLAFSLLILVGVALAVM